MRNHEDARLRMGFHSLASGWSLGVELTESEVTCMQDSLDARSRLADDTLPLNPDSVISLTCEREAESATFCY
jgi:hypothetical protein